jgi:hypothetical protein
LARNLASPYLGCEPKVRVATLMKTMLLETKQKINMLAVEQVVEHENFEN